jgi:hypothetical protein
LDQDRNVVRSWVSTITDDIQDAFNSADSGPTSFLSRLRTGLADAIGAGFNISGRSPLIALLVPLLGAIGALIVAAVQAVNGLVALLVTIPGLLAAIGLQVGVLVLAFQGMGTAIGGAFAAKNAKELNEAIKDLTPSAQQFVKELLPLRELFDGLRRLVQESFFSNLGSLFGTDGALTPILNVLSRLGGLAGALGRFARQIALAFGSPAMVDFIERLIPVTIKWLDMFGPAMRQFFEGLAKFAGSPAVLDMLEQVGTWVSTIFSEFGAFLFDLAGDQGFAAWLDNMKLTLESVGNLILATLQFAAVLLDQLDKAGGRDVIDKITEAVNVLTTFLASDVGKKGLEGLLNTLIFLMQAFTGLVIVILLFFAVLEKWFEILNLLFRVVTEGLQGLWGDIVDFFVGLGQDIVDALGDPTDILYNAGKMIVQGLINGLKSMLNPLRSTMGIVTAVVNAFLPNSPAKEGPLSGMGDPLLSGKEIVNRLAAGITAGRTELGSVMNQTASIISFAPGAVRVGFDGALPTEQQAMQTGMAAGAGIASILARNAVRTI